MASTLRVERIWTLQEARQLITALQSHLRKFGFHVCLGGGVLNNGTSKKDLDLYFLPLDREGEKVDTPALLDFLTETWGPGVPMRTPALKNDSRLFEPDDNPFRQLDRTFHVGDLPAISADPPVTPDYPMPPGSPYSHKLKFGWSGLRIDVFIISMRNEAAASDDIVDAKPLAPEGAMPEGMAPPATTRATSMWRTRDLQQELARAQAEATVAAGIIHDQGANVLTADQTERMRDYLEQSQLRAADFARFTWDGRPR